MTFVSLLRKRNKRWQATCSFCIGKFVNLSEQSVPRHYSSDAHEMIKFDLNNTLIDHANSFTTRELCIRYNLRLRSTICRLLQ